MRSYWLHNFNFALFYFNKIFGPRHTRRWICWVSWKCSRLVLWLQCVDNVWMNHGLAFVRSVGWLRDPRIVLHKPMNTVLMWKRSADDVLTLLSAVRPAFTVSALLCSLSANSVNEIISLKFALNSQEQLEASAGIGGVNRRRLLVEIQGCQLRPASRVNVWWKMSWWNWWNRC